MTWDVFISYAGEDREDVARPLASILEQAGVAVWFDVEQLQLGDSLRGTIDRGLADSRHGVVILSPAFFSKEWPERELNGLLALESRTRKTVLPIWHNVDKGEVARYSPILADKLAVSTRKGLNAVASEILRVLELTTVHLEYVFSIAHDEIVRCADFSPDNKWLATGCESGTVEFTRLASRKVRAIPNVHDGSNGVNVVSFSPDSTLLVSGGFLGTTHDGNIVIWDAATAEVRFTLRAHGGQPVTFACFCSNNRRMVTATDAEIAIWDLTSKNIVKTMPSRFSAMMVVLDRYLVLGAGKRRNETRINMTTLEYTTAGLLDEGSITVYDVSSDRISAMPHSLSGAILDFAFHEGDNQLLALTADNVIHWIDWGSGDLKRKIGVERSRAFQKESGIRLGGQQQIGLVQPGDIVIFNDMKNTLLLNYKDDRATTLDHRSMVSVCCSKTENMIAVLGGIHNKSLTGTDQDFWTTSVFSLQFKK